MLGCSILDLNIIQEGNIPTKENEENIQQIWFKCPQVEYFQSGYIQNNGISNCRPIIAGSTIYAKMHSYLWDTEI